VKDSNARAAFETGRGRLCGGCGWPLDDCHCSTTTATQSVPTKIRCVLRLEKKGRGGKTVTVVAGLPRNASFLATLASDLKRACGTGGTATDDAVEIQGDQRERLRPLLAARGYAVKG